ncbi:hypothetical protein [Pseudorhodoferax sp. Leaf267]|uniref:hypothetical protein n=1 Tax=Pseudorhodoferax sp. Leaf267 TaxID=1736316 RepID=UPI0006FFDF15|nr:hypothetical protein [Pseudorhodoferax sp. Leaf267]KQP22609.1 hypothetical protein ASF43_01435 [Pseudorhodoferax sp. Leaf267]
MDDCASVPPPAGASLLQGRFAGREAFQQGIRNALHVAAVEGWREIVVSDPGFEDWPLGERSVCADLQAWARPGRSFVMLACRYDEVVRRHARFVTWRTTWSHLVDARACRAADAQELPSAMIGPGWAMRRLDTVHSAGVAGHEPDRRVHIRESVAEWLRQSAPAFPSSVLGL